MGSHSWSSARDLPEVILRWEVTHLDIGPVTFRTHALRPGTQNSALATTAGRLTIPLVMDDRDLPELEGLPLMLTADHVANLLGVSREAIYKMNERGELPAGRKFGRRLRFPRPAIKEWLLAH